MTRIDRLYQALLMAIMICVPALSFALTPNEVLTKCAAKINGAPSIEAKFSGSASGTLTVSGQKFSMVTGGFGIWYDGTDMWTYSKRAGETSLTEPTASELLETNPIEIIKSYQTKFDAKKVSESGNKYTIQLTSTAKNNNVRSAILVINTATWWPVSIDINFANDTRMVVNISSIKEGTTLPRSKFKYPESIYPGIEVVDLR